MGRALVLLLAFVLLVALVGFWPAVGWAVLGFVALAFVVDARGY